MKLLLSYYLPYICLILVSFGSCYLFIKLIIKEHHVKLIKTGTGVIVFHILQASLRFIPRLIIIVIAFFAGYLIRDLKQFNKRFTYTSVAVVTKIADRDFVIWPARMKQEHVVICPQSTVAWHEGETLEDFTFEQEQGCKYVVSYHEKGELNARR